MVTGISARSVLMSAQPMHVLNELALTCSILLNWLSHTCELHQAYLILKLKLLLCAAQCTVVHAHIRWMA